MSDIQPIGPSAIPAVTRADRPARVEASPSAATRSGDKAEISIVATLLSKLAENPVRVDLVNSIRQQLEAGTYDEQSKVDAAIDNLADDL